MNYVQSDSLKASLANKLKDLAENLQSELSQIALQEGREILPMLGKWATEETEALAPKEQDDE